MPGKCSSYSYILHSFYTASLNTKTRPCSLSFSVTCRPRDRNKVVLLEEKCSLACLIRMTWISMVSQTEKYCYGLADCGELIK